VTEESTALKETLFNREILVDFAEAIRAVYPAFDQDSFLAGVFDEDWAGRALMDRMRHVTTVLHAQLPAGYRTSLDVLLKALPGLKKVGGFVGMVPCDYVAVYGLDDPDASLPALEAFTQLVSAEFAVRPFIVRYPERTMAQMVAWADHEHPDVRRLASEGCRPRLPWGIRLQQLVEDPAPIIPILEKLKNDDSESVRRSVANNLNDISKDHPQQVVSLLHAWNAEAEGDEQVQWITRQALRTLVKKGDADALELLGYPAEPQIVVRQVRVEPASLAIGDSLTLSFEIESNADEDQNLIVDYVVYHMRANGEQTPKVFKHKQVGLAPGEVVKIRKKHSFRPVTTRTYYPGQHGIQPQINGQPFERVDFELTG
jgi:3-methyladenine DNA glycosylase AlkC